MSMNILQPVNSKNSPPSNSPESKSYGQKSLKGTSSDRLHSPKTPAIHKSLNENRQVTKGISNHSTADQNLNPIAVRNFPPNESHLFWKVVGPFKHSFDDALIVGNKTAALSARSYLKDPDPVFRSEERNKRIRKYPLDVILG